MDLNRYRNLSSIAYRNELLGGWADFLVEGAEVVSSEDLEAILDDGNRLVVSKVRGARAYRVAFVQKNTEGDILRFGLDVEEGLLIVTGCNVAGFGTA